MDLIMFYYLLFQQLCVILSSEISKKCVCVHVRTENDCKNSGLCIWEIDKCILKPGQSYNTEMSNSNQCKRYAQEDCREQEQCGFYFGQCIDFVDCMVFDKDNCQESSYKCVSNGEKCIQIKECIDYKTENECGNKNKYNKYCFWMGETEKKCLDVITCEGLPTQLNNHQMCKSGLNGCTLSEQGYGCIQLMELCSQYANNFQCFESKKNNCYWDSKNLKCVEKVCENLLFTQDYECKEILSHCTTNGVHCVKRKQCSDAQSIFGCVTDAEGKKCEYHQSECKIKSCNTAPESLKNYQQCQDYDNLLDCVIVKQIESIILQKTKDVKHDLKHAMVMLKKWIAILQQDKTVYGIKINANKDNVIMHQFILLMKIVIFMGIAQVDQMEDVK